MQTRCVRGFDCLANDAADPVPHASPTENHDEGRREQNKTQDCWLMVRMAMVVNIEIG